MVGGLSAETALATGNGCERRLTTPMLTPPTPATIDGPTAEALRAPTSVQSRSIVQPRVPPLKLRATTATRGRPASPKPSANATPLAPSSPIALAPSRGDIIGLRVAARPAVSANCREKKTSPEEETCDALSRESFSCRERKDAALSTQSADEVTDSSAPTPDPKAPSIGRPALGDATSLTGATTEADAEGDPTALDTLPRPLPDDARRGVTSAPLSDNGIGIGDGREKNVGRAAAMRSSPSLAEGAKETEVEEAGLPSALGRTRTNGCGSSPTLGIFARNDN